MGSGPYFLPLLRDTAGCNLACRSVALKHPSLWVAIVSGGTAAQLVDWTARHMQVSHSADRFIAATLASA